MNEIYICDDCRLIINNNINIDDSAKFSDKYRCDKKTKTYYHQNNNDTLNSKFCIIFSFDFTDPNELTIELWGSCTSLIDEEYIIVLSSNPLYKSLSRDYVEVRYTTKENLIKDIDYIIKKIEYTTLLG